MYGSAIIEAQKKAIVHLPENGNLVIIGGGDGTLLPYLYKKKPSLEILYIESSGKMIELAHRNKKNGQNIKFTLTDDFSLDGFQADAIFAPFVLDTFKNSEITEVINTINSQCKKRPKWLVVDFDHNKVLIGPWYNKLRTTLSIYFFRITTGYQPKKLPHIFETIRLQYHKSLKIIDIESKMFSCVSF